MPKYIHPKSPEMGTEEDYETQSYWPLCYPRIYDNVSAYTSPKAMAFDLATIFMDHTTLFRRSTQLDQDTNRTAIIGAASFHATRLTDLQVPTFFVERDLLMALSKTTPPEAIDWKALHLPFDAAAFILPAGAITVPGSGSISFLWYSRAFEGDTVSIPSGVPHKLTLPKSQMYIRTVLAEKPGSPAIVHHIIDSEANTLIDLSKSLEDNDIMPGSVPFSDAERKLGAVLAGLVFNLVLAMEARPELLTQGNPNGKRSKRGSEFWLPNIIGKSYRVSRNGGQGVTGLTQRMHWRRGHWRNQVYGVQRSLHRQVWIEPTLVAAD
jgi:hypothetical protein